MDCPVLITGHSGFKGSWLTTWLGGLGAVVSGFSLLPEVETSLSRLATGGNCRNFFGDIRDAVALHACLASVRPRIVFHLAAQSLVRPSYQDPVGTYATNVMGTVNLLEAVRATPSVQAVVVVTSDKCYENREWLWAYRENEALGGHDPYSSSKGCAELVTAAYRASFFNSPSSACRISTARAGNVIGGGDWAIDRLVPDVVRAFVREASVEIRSPLSTRPWQHVLEPLAGYIRLAECLLARDGGSYAESWNFGPAESDCRPVSYVVDRLATGWGGKAGWHLSNEVHPHEASFLKVDASKARERLRWERRLQLDDALDWTVDWYRQERDGRSAESMTSEQIQRYQSLGSSAS